MNNWQKITLGNYIDTITDYHANGAYEKLKENITLKYETDYAIMIRTLNFESNDFKNNLIYLNEFEYNYLAKSKVQPFDLVMNKIANPGSVYLMPELNKPVSLAMNLFLIRFNKQLDQKFMFYLLKINEPYIKRFANGTTTKTITKDAVRALEFDIPNLNYQINISTLLFSIDSKIELNNRINAELEAMAKTLYDYWFVQFDFPDKNGKPYKTSGGNMVWNEELKREIPEGWEVGTLGDVAELVRGVTYGSDDIKSQSASDVIPILRATNISGNVVDLNNMVYVSKQNVSHAQLLNKYDILITMSSGSKEHIGKNGFFYYEREASFGAFCAKIVAHAEYRYYLYSFTQSDFMFTTIKNECLGTNINNLNGSLVKGFKLIIPPNELINSFNVKVNSVYEKIGNNLKENQKLTELRDWLLPMLMNGQVKVG
jgi:type I restriction enzyme S subunit